MAHFFARPTPPTLVIMLRALGVIEEVRFEHQLRGSKVWGVMKLK